MLQILRTFSWRSVFDFLNLFSDKRSCVCDVKSSEQQQSEAKWLLSSSGRKHSSHQQLRVFMLLQSLICFTEQDATLHFYSTTFQETSSRMDCKSWVSVNENTQRKYKYLTLKQKYCTWVNVLSYIPSLFSVTVSFHSTLLINI